jgi:transposase
METKRPKLPTLRQFQERFPTEDACLEHLMRTRYGQRHVCAKCEREAKYYRVKARRSYECEHCGYQVYPTAGTPFEKTRTSLRDWFHVMFLFCTSRNGVSAKEIQRTIGVTYKTAWRMAKLIRAYMAYVDGDDMIGGPESKGVEIDHGFIGGEDRMGESDKLVVLGMIERGGNVVTRVLPNRKSENVLPTIKGAIKPGTHITSDAEHTFGAIPFLGQGYQHTEIKRRAGEFKVDGQTTSHVEGFWNLVKRGIRGTYISVSAKHLPTYLGEFEFRYNLRKSPHLMLPLMMTSFARGV